ncbi:hypothetical protein DVQ78_11790, partial [Yersinia enterocolitica]|nr:hypothetical protein [Yersinia enterocolitica]
ALMFTGVSVHHTTFLTTDGFPSTGFIGAEFTLAVPGSASDYTWNNGGNAWTAVDNTGRVTFTAKGNSTPVTITATPKAGGAPLTYTFTVSSWFINNGSTTMNWNDASAWCTAQRTTQPTRVQLTQGEDTRGIGALWSEWGDMGYYSSSGFFSANAWTSEAGDGVGYHYRVLLSDGYVHSDTDRFALYVVCRQGL